MNDNWSEIIEIMKPVLDSGRSRIEVKMALSSCLRTLGWRTSTGSMQNDFVTESGKTVDIVLGHRDEDKSFRAILPIKIQTEELDTEILDYITNVMKDMKVRISIVAGRSFKLFFLDEISQNALCLGEINIELDNEEGMKFTSLLSADDFTETNLNAYFESLSKEKLPEIRLNKIIESIITDKSKAEEVLRTYLELEGFEGKVVDNALENVVIDVFYKNKDFNNNPEPERKFQKTERQESSKSGHDNTRFSINGGTFLSKKQFVRGVVSKYIQDHPNITLEELEEQFPSELASKVRGVIKTLSQVQLWAKQNGPDILTRYCTKDEEILTLYDGTKIVVNSQWGSKNFPRFLALAKSLYDVKSDAPYEEVEYTQSTNNRTTTRAQNFKFSMVGIRIGETIVFDATNTQVKVASDDTVEYKGNTYRLSSFVRTYLPDSMRTPSDTYRGPDYFSYNGQSLTKLRYNKSTALSSQTASDENEGKNNGIQISLRSFNSFKTKK